MQVEITALAEEELDEAVTWYRAQAPATEQRFLAEFQAATRRIAAHPTLYIEIRSNVRRGLMNHFPYSLVYECDGNVLRILAVAHQHRRPAYWIDRVR